VISTTYILITPAKNEANYIAETINSVVGQILKPAEWIIVNDGSTDSTEKIVREASDKYPWIKLISRPTKGGHAFDSVVRTIEYGTEYISVKDYAFIGLIDADVRFKKDYFIQLIKKMEKNPRIGLSGGIVIDVTSRTQRIPKNNKDIPGSTQFFRKECFENLGRLIAVPEGGWDTLTCVKARMLGYDTVLYTDLIVEHLKPRNVSQGSPIKRVWNFGIREYALGYHPYFEILKCIDRINERPFLIGSIIRLLAYILGRFLVRERVVPEDLIKFLRNEQLQRIKEIFTIVNR